MPRDGGIIFADFIGKLDVLRVTCDVCKRDGCYGLARLIRVYGRDAKLRDWLDVITADCPKKIARNDYSRCGAKCPPIAEGDVDAMMRKSLRSEVIPQMSKDSHSKRML